MLQHQPTRVIWIFLLPQTLDCAVKRAKESAPDAKVASEHRGARLDGRQRSDASLAVRRIAEALDAVPDSSSDGLETRACQRSSHPLRRQRNLTYSHTKRSSKVIERHPWTRISGVIHDAARPSASACTLAIITRPGDYVAAVDGDSGNGRR